MADKYTSDENLLTIEEVNKNSKIETNGILIRPERCMFDEEMVNNYAKECIFKLKSQGQTVVAQNRYSGILDGKKCYHHILFIKKSEVA